MKDKKRQQLRIANIELDAVEENELKMVQRIGQLIIENERLKKELELLSSCTSK